MEKWKLRPDVVLRTVEGQTMLIAVLGAIGECEDIWEINETAETYLRALMEPCSEKDLVRLAAGMYDADPEVLREDIREFIGYLQRGRYLVSGDEGCADQPGTPGAEKSLAGGAVRCRQ